MPLLTEFHGKKYLCLLTDFYFALFMNLPFLRLAGIFFPKCKTKYAFFVFKFLQQIPTDFHVKFNFGV